MSISEIAQDLSPPALIAAIEANLFAAFAGFGRMPQVEFSDGPEAMWFCTGVPFPLLNGVFRARFAPEAVDRGIERLLDLFKARRVPMIWWTGPATRPADLGNRLVAHGLTHAGDSPGMAADLSALMETTRPPGLTIEQANAETLSDWLRPFARGFDIPQFAANAMADFLVTVGFGGSGPWRHYVGRRDGEHVACSSLFLGAGVAGIYNVAIIPEARRRGLGAAMTLAPLHEARATGYRIGILQSSQIGLGVYRRLGFQEYCTVSHYVLVRDESPNDKANQDAPGGQP